MTSNFDLEKPLGVLGAGSFGTTVANLLAARHKVFMYSRNPERVKKMQETRKSRDYDIHPNVTPCADLEQVVKSCHVLFPVIPSSSFRNLMREMSPMLRPYHIMLHGTKGLDIHLPEGMRIDDYETLSRNEIKTMSEVIVDETSVKRVGCIAGPNLARELADGHPAATVVASHFEEVISFGIKFLRSDRFQVYGNSDLIGIELAGVLKNIIAIAAGALNGLGYGENAKGMLISRGMVEIMYLGRAMGGDIRAFLGLAGVGDLVATCNSTLSRNFTVGSLMARGATLEEVTNEMEEVAEGINTVKIMTKIAQHYKVKAPITQTLYKVLFEEMPPEEALQYLMKYPFHVDIEFLRNLE